MSRCPLYLGLLSSLLLAAPALAQQVLPAVPEPSQAEPYSPPPLDDPTAPLLTEPAPATRQLYVRQRVRTVVKVRLNAEGQPRDTIEYQEIDAEGRRTLLRRYGSRWQDRREWSYDNAGHCTAQVIHPMPGRPFTTIYTYNPALRQGRCEVLQTNGRRTTVCALQQQQIGDTLLTETYFQPLVIGTYRFTATGIRRTWRFTLHADTVLTLVRQYTPEGQPEHIQLQYERRRHDQPQESGLVDIQPALKAQWTSLATPADAPVSIQHLIGVLRHSPQHFKPNMLFAYDARQRLQEQEQISTARIVPNLPTRGTFSPRALTASALPFRLKAETTTRRTTISYTYNDLDQLIGQQRQQVLHNLRPTRSYTVFSYLPTGLLVRETIRPVEEKSEFYQYHYSYYP